jgi:ribosomal protein S18 acetylase RimI-like enzyme
MALAQNTVVGMKSAEKILLNWGRRVGRIFPSWIMRILDKGYDLITKFNVVEMRLKDLSHLPPIRIPGGYTVRKLEPGHEQDYVDVMRLSLKKDADSAWFRQNFPEDKDYDPRNLVLIYREERPVAAAAAWDHQHKNKKMGHLKSVGVVRDCQGSGLGRLVSLVALHLLKDRGFDEIILKTHRSQIRAVQLYLSLGFEPRYNLWAGKRKWRRMLSKIGQS